MPARRNFIDEQKIRERLLPAAYGSLFGDQQKILSRDL
jgi:hypothetical protein